MPPRGRRQDPRATGTELAATLADQWQRIVDAVSVLPDGALGVPSPLPGWTVGDLVLHVSRSASALTEALAPAVPASRRTTDLVTARDLVTASGYLTGAGTRTEAVADTARSLAANRGPAEIRGRLAGEVSAAVAAMAAVTQEAVVPTPGGPMRLAEFLRTRAVEAVVHGLDLGVTPVRDALRAATKVFAEMFAERAPGRSVELRVPPFTAVQIVEGPRHTRGTPPNVVEAEPVAFVLLCAGRLPWAEAVADGRVAASGERADLSSYLPLL
ncbi:hypothetical protein CcI156_12105 [Frankia sp. CcI156]|uniref:Mycothiol-dependent maleylpyruvate isomerase metal-binding domain-containing protein n=1 Tax=Frankia casuarinae (strain DSM 45818 / CECT 9043 / HFP020203 / CcI3) TaxID=106370 RepID=Q2JGV5_FRACC|nr:MULTISPECIES: sterol carrier family protein [Frankia]ABD09487.1 conserved hypothetical protein [Frankia casuarinae]ETA02820.1 hypothetical protein CcI6DRAFT_01780 [Frankia sp. CcI6]EYT94107.1 hypothetical protein ThrDRAFT_00031 [Frankia casuarinae]KDA44297.1 hypothetical protein BMG523Draft_00796 [Frankia sp. BMG5.23]KFB06744.1 hypothetical protein ALLO2DRAFT_00030 [Frankia sp. Allo2]